MLIMFDKRSIIQQSISTVNAHAQYSTYIFDLMFYHVKTYNFLKCSDISGGKSI